MDTINDDVTNSTPTKLHSVTFYIPANRIEFFTIALKKVSQELYGNEKRTVSKYIRDLIYTDLQKRGFLDFELNPIKEGKHG